MKTLPPTRIRRLIRLRCGLTQDGLAEKIGVSVGSISNYERGLTEPKGEDRERYQRWLYRNGGNMNTTEGVLALPKSIQGIGTLTADEGASLLSQVAAEGGIEVVTEKSGKTFGRVVLSGQSPTRDPKPTPERVVAYMRHFEDLGYVSEILAPSERGSGIQERHVEYLDGVPWKVHYTFRLTEAGQAAAEALAA